MDASSARERAAALAVLGLAVDATDEEITRAYRRLARLTHPDVTGRTDVDAAQRFTAISQAYQRLVPAPGTPSPQGREPPPEPPVPWPPRAPSAHLRGARPPIVAGPARVTPLGASARSARRGPR